MPRIFLAAILCASSLSAADDVLARVAAHADRFGAVSRQIWETPELGYHEAKSSALLQAELRANGFEVRADLAGMPTAFIATFGSGKPVIGLMGEFDALPGLSQHDSPELSPVVAGAPGHGCGHNLLGSAALLAATAVKDWLATHKVPGRVRYYGCPAEEGGAAKAFMVRSGAFDDADIAITWHPSSFWEVVVTPSLANTQIGRAHV